jgi:hypothetical protein
MLSVALAAALVAASPLLLSRIGVSLAVIFLVIPSIAAARYFGGTKLGHHARFWAIFSTMMVVWYPLFFLLIGFATDPQPTLDWLCGAVGTTSGKHDVAMNRTLRVAAGAGFLGICCYGYWVLRQRFRARRGSRLASEAKTDVETLADDTAADANAPV